MATIVIDGKTYEVKDGQNVLSAALSLGLDVPYFCWHPKLGSIGACRQCAVQHFRDATDTQGKVVMACMTPAINNTHLSISHPQAASFRKNVIEWMMTNHPHDCPVCDEGGECHLQDMTVMTGHNYRRYNYKKRTFRNQNLGPYVNHEMNRCITCYRCVRFYRDYAGGTDLNSYASSNRVYFGRHADGQLESEFSGNLVEVCPTGVFTDKQFQQSYTRKWDLTTAPSVCQLCSLGCNILPAERYGTLRRVQNRFNYDVNGYFICDAGRFGHTYVNDPQRLSSYQLRDGDAWQTSDCATATSTVQEWITAATTVVGIGSAQGSLEANAALKRVVGGDHFYSGVNDTEHAIAKMVADWFKSGHLKPWSMQQAETADAVIVIGEDLHKSAPRLALAVRQTNFHKAASLAKAIGVPEWNDAAVRNHVRSTQGPIAILSAMPTKLDREAMVVKRGDTAVLINELTSCKELDFVKAAQKVLVVAGASAGSIDLVKAAAGLAKELEALGKNVGVQMVLSKPNSLGLALLDPKPMAALFTTAAIDVAVVVENDLASFTQSCDWQKFRARVKHLVVLDSLPSVLTASASAILPVCAFTEYTGLLVNNEGRAQRFYQMMHSKQPMVASWRQILQLFKNSPAWHDVDDIRNELAAIPVFKNLRHIVGADFRVLGSMKLPRQTPAFSGRTAINTQVSMHEPKPPADSDSPFSFSMEGYQGKRRLPVLSFVSSPGWNSVAALTKFQEQVGGPTFAHQDSVRLFDATGEPGHARGHGRSEREGMSQRANGGSPS